MKKLAVQNKDECRACLACVNACSEAFYKEMSEALSCIQIGFNKKGAFKTFVCTQCGKCAKVCEEGAITQNKKGVYVIDKKKCVNCGKCVEECPSGVMVRSPKKETPSKCIACGICVKACPVDVLYIKEDEAAQ